MLSDNEVPSQSERELAASVAHRAMIAGWKKAIEDAAAKEGILVLAMENILNKVYKDQKHRDPSARIDELADYDEYQRNRVDLAPKRQNGSNLHKLSPGLRSFMEKKLASKA